MASQPSISIAGLTALTWVMTVAALLMTVGRFAIRYKSSAPFIASDYINGLACVALIVYMATFSSYFRIYYAVQYPVADGELSVSEHDLVIYYKTAVSLWMLFWVILFLAKASFLMLYRSIFKVSTRFMQMWWAVTAFTAVSFLMVFFSTLWICGYDPAHDLFKLEHCVSQQAETAAANVAKFSCAVNVVSDFLIILLPLHMLRSLQMSHMAKIGLALIFTVGLLDVICTIVRTVLDVYGRADSHNNVVAIIEPAIAVMVCAAPTYKNTRVLFSKKRNNQQQQQHHARREEEEEEGRSCDNILQHPNRWTPNGTGSGGGQYSNAGRTFFSSSTHSSHPPTSQEDLDRILVERTYEVRAELPEKAI